jgi:hypothetical protein
LGERADLRQGQRGCSASGANPGAVEDVLHVLGHSRRRDEQNPSDVRVAVALGRESENLYLPAAQARNPAAAEFSIEVHLMQMWSEQAKNE